MSTKVSRDPVVNWANDAIQFPRLIAEMEAVGAFTDGRRMSELEEAMDLEQEDIMELVARAQAAWDDIKDTLT